MRKTTEKINAKKFLGKKSIALFLAIWVLASCVDASFIPLTDIMYRNSPIIARAGIPMTILVYPTLSPAQATATYTINADLPEGMELDSTTGEIRGMATEAHEGTSYSITATGVGEYSGSVSTEISITIYPPFSSVTSVVIPEGNQTVTVGAADITLTAVVEVVGDAAETVTWSTSKAATASVSSTGEVTIGVAGTARITATSTADNTKSASITITVKVAPAVNSVTIDGNAAITKTTADAPFTLVANVVAVGGASSAVNWISSDTAVATVVPSTGKVTIKAAGTTNIKATSVDDNTKSDSVALTVNVAPAVTGVTIPKGNQSVSVGDAAVQLSAEVTTEGTPAPASTVTWSTNNAAVAFVSNTGLVTIGVVGEAIITATSTADNTKSASITVTVSEKGIEPAVNSVAIGDGSATLTKITTDAAFTLVANVVVVGGASSAVNWTSSNTAVATVSATGLVTIKAAGTANIKASSTVDNTKSATLALTVKVAPAVTGVTIGGAATRTVNAGSAAVQLSATVAVVGTPAPASTVAWTSSNATVATVSATGLVTIKAAGTANIKASSTADGTKSATVAFTVNVAPAVTGVTIGGAATRTVYAGSAAVQLSATVATVGTPAPASTVVWTSSNTAVATVSATGLVTIKAVGTANIKAASTVDGTKSATVAFTVNIAPAVTGVTIPEGFQTVSVGDAAVQLTAIVAVVGTPAPASTVTWSTNNAATASVSSTGEVTIGVAGTARITATSTADNTKSASITVTVSEKGIEPAVNSVAIGDGSATLTNLTKTTADAPFTLVANVVAVGGASSAVNWTSSNTAVATVSATGLVTIKAAGTANIKASSTVDNTKSATLALTVNVAPAVTGVTIPEGFQTVSVGDAAVQLTAIVAVVGTPAPASTVTWSTNNAATASVSSTGEVTIGVAGTAIITATSTADGTKFASITVTVSEKGIEPAVNSVAIGDGSATLTNLTKITTDAAFTLVANVVAVGGASSAVNWTSSNTAVATVSATGLVTIKAAGTANIKASSTVDNTKSATLALTVKVAPAVTGVTIGGAATRTVNAGSAAVQLSATVAVVGTPAPATTVVWTSSNTAVVTVSATGLVTIKAVGTANIKAASTVDGTKSATVAFTVKVAPAVTGVTIDGAATRTATVGDAAVQLTATVAVVGTPAPATTVTWTSSNTAVATVSATGLVTILAVGTANIIASSTVDPAKSATLVLTVYKAPLTATDIILSDFIANATVGTPVAAGDLPSVSLTDGVTATFSIAPTDPTKDIGDVSISPAGVLDITTNKLGLADYTITASGTGTYTGSVTKTITVSSKYIITAADLVGVPYNDLAYVNQGNFYDLQNAAHLIAGDIEGNNIAVNPDNNANVLTFTDNEPLKFYGYRNHPNTIETIDNTNGKITVGTPNLDGLIAYMVVLNENLIMDDTSVGYTAQVTGASASVAGLANMGASVVSTTGADSTYKAKSDSWTTVEETRALTPDFTIEDGRHLSITFLSVGTAIVSFTGIEIAPPSTVGFVPTMTGTFTPSGEVLFNFEPQSSTSNLPWNSFDHNYASGSWTYSKSNADASNFPLILGYQNLTLTKGSVLESVNISVLYGTVGPKDFIVQGITDEGSWTDIQEFTDITYPATTEIHLPITSGHTGAHKGFRLYITATNSTYATIILKELEFHVYQ